MSASKLDPARAALIVIDIQEAFRKALPNFEQVTDAAATLVQGAAAIGIPVVVTEQYPKGLGATVQELARHIPADAETIEKTKFSAVAADGFGLGEREQAVVCGIEAHVCVNQTVLDLLDEDVEVHVAADAVGSRTDANREIGIAKMERAGALITSVEMALFELLGGADAEAFKQVQALVK